MNSPGPTQLVRPSAIHLPSYRDALQRGWSADNVRGRAAAEEELAEIAADATAFLASKEDREAVGPPVKLPDGSWVPRLPGLVRWMWDGEFVGSINLRWQAGSAELPPHCLGHIGFAVVPWKRGLGHATAGLSLLLPLARELGLPWVMLTTDTDNLGSQQVITANGGTRVGAFNKPAAYGGHAGVMYRIELTTR